MKIKVYKNNMDQRNKKKSKQKNNKGFPYKKLSKREALAEVREEFEKPKGLNSRLG